MSKHKEKLIIIDGNALIHRSFHALPPSIQTKKGEPTNAVYGFTSVLIKAIKDFSPEYIVLTLDKKGPTFRHEEFSEYKAKREKAPDELYSQFPRVKEIAKAFGVPIFEKSGYEADDLIGTISKTTDGTIDKIILTGDMDTLQLIDDSTKVYTMSRGMSDSVIYDETAVKEKYGIGVEQVIDYKALRGDPSDNIPGVRGVGEKTAVEIIQKFGNLDNLYNYLEGKKEKIDKSILKNDLDNVFTERIKNLLIEHKEDAILSKSLATIKLDVDIKFDLEKARFGNLELDKILELFSELEFKSLLPRVQELSKKETKETSANKFERDKSLFKYIIVETEKEFNKFLKELKKQKHFSFDTETSGFDPISSELLGISFSWKADEAFYLVVAGEERVDKEVNLFNYSNPVETKTKSVHPWLEKLKPIFENKNIGKCAHNMKFDMKVMMNNGVNVLGIDFDTMLASFILNSSSRQHNLDVVTFSELGFEKISTAELLGSGKDKKTFSELDTELLGIYSCEDADFTNKLYLKLSKLIKKNNFTKLFNDLEIPLIRILADMEQSGIKLDVGFLKKLGADTHKKLESIQKKTWKEAGEDFNINSTKQLKVILFEKLAISTFGISKTKTGFSTSADELEKLKEQHQIIPLIQEYRELNKLISTYIDTLPELVNEKTGRIHTSYNQTVAATGRLSSTDPNMQNIPVKTELGRNIRKAFVAEEGKVFVAFDYSQIELRIAAHLSGDTKMIKAFKDKVDIHTATAAEINGVKIDEVTSEMRREAKAVNFGVLYGQGPHGLAQNVDISYARAKEFIDQYFDSYKKVRQYLDKVIEQARVDGCVETMLGRKRLLPEINSSMAMVRKGAERMAINTPIQGTAADLIKKAMVDVYDFINIKYNKDDVKMLLQVHDELLFEVDEKVKSNFTKEIKGLMENVFKLKVPLIVDYKEGKNWKEME
ncbi:DNA polymerase I [Candidatus Parcubacteria bacterium]|mgnify:CR=1 FL=1|nr:MAG: DNA polymerase I [Candidatus Parcubacteria bacterium]